MLLDIETILARAEDIDAMGPRVFGRILQTVDAGAGSLYLLDSGGASLRVYSRDGSVNQMLRVEPGSGFAGWAASKGEEICIRNPAADPRYDRTLLKRSGIDVSNVAALPMPFAEGAGIRGALLVANKSAHTGFSEADMLVLRLSAAQLAQAIEHLMDRDARERERRLATVGRLLAGVLHDLKSPITVISGYAEMLAEQVPGDEGAAYLDKIRHALSRITNMARDIVAFSRGEREIMPHPIQLSDFVDHFVQQITLYLQSNNIDFVVRVRTAGTIRIDEEKMIRAFNNIAVNAVEAMPDQGRLIFEVDRIGNDLVFSFTDFGKGIPEEIQGTLFHSFVTMGKDQGSGLGLALARKIIDSHGGRINYTTSRGGGTTFLISIPIAGTE
jgi:signal transduction histidine kinase